MSSTTTPTTYVVSGFPQCPYYQKAKKHVSDLAASRPTEIAVKLVELPRDQYHEHRKAALTELGKQDGDHKTCPLVYTIDDKGKAVKYIGGADNTVAYKF